MNTLSSSFSKQLDTQGFVHLESFRTQISTLRLAGELGKIENIPGFAAVQRLVPIQKTEALPNSYSGNYGMQEFPLHTDLAHWYVPPRYLMLRCVIPAPSVFTALANGPRTLAGIPQETMLRAQFLPRKQVGGKRHLLRFLQKVDGTYLLRWDDLFLIPANREAWDISDYIKKVGNHLAAKMLTFSNPGDTLIVDNWKMLHSRSSVPSNSTLRLVERVYLKEMNR